MQAKSIGIAELAAVPPEILFKTYTYEDLVEIFRGNTFDKRVKLEEEETGWDDLHGTPEHSWSR